MSIGIIIVHGKKPLRSGDMQPAFRERLDLAARLAKQGDYREILITGGPTRAGVVAEAQMGQKYLAGKTKFPIRLEDKSRTTAENIKFTKSLVGSRKHVRDIAVVTSAVCIPRTRYLYKRLWPQVYNKATFVGTIAPSSLLSFLLERVYYLYALVDPNEHYAGYLKRLFRNT